MSEFNGALVVVLAINVILFMSQLSIGQMNPDTNFYSCKGTIIGDFEASNCTGSDYKLDTEMATETDNYPSNPTVLDSVGNFFTDIYNSVKSWFMDSLGAKYVINVLKAPYNFLALTGMPDSFVFILGTFWYIITFFLLIQEVRG